MFSFKVTRMTKLNNGEKNEKLADTWNICSIMNRGASNNLKCVTVFARELKLLLEYVILILFKTIIKSVTFNNH